MKALGAAGTTSKFQSAAPCVSPSGAGETGAEPAVQGILASYPAPRSGAEEKLARYEDGGVAPAPP